MKSSINTYHKKDKNFSLNAAYSANYGYLYMRKGGEVKFVARFDAADEPTVEQDLINFTQNGTIRDRRSIGEFIDKYSHSRGMEGESVSVAQKGRGGDVQSDKMDIREGANVRTDDERMATSISPEETRKRDEQYVKAVNEGDAIATDKILSLPIAFPAEDLLRQFLPFLVR